MGGGGTTYNQSSCFLTRAHRFTSYHSVVARLHRCSPRLAAPRDGLLAARGGNATFQGIWILNRWFGLDRLADRLEVNALVYLPIDFIGCRNSAITVHVINAPQLELAQPLVLLFAVETIPSECAPK